jgi:hypothetical protein
MVKVLGEWYDAGFTIRRIYRELEDMVVIGYEILYKGKPYTPKSRLPKDSEADVYDWFEVLKKEVENER